MGFRDPEFPANDRSIGPIEGLPAGIRWLRLHKLDGVGKRVKLFGNVSADNIEQGEVGDCWLLAAMATVADFPGHVMDLFRPLEYATDGKYEIRLFNPDRAEWESVIIDDQVPCYADRNQPVFCKVQRGGGTWALLLEKAFAKFAGGSYAELDGRDGASWSMTALTGVTSQFYFDRIGDDWERSKLGKRSDSTRLLQSLLPCFSGFQSEAHDDDSLFNYLAYCSQANFLLSASITSYDDADEERADGLINSHEYSIRSIQKAQDRCMVKIRNPWGRCEWNGKWSDSSQMWKKYPQLSEDLNVELDPDDGQFWMEWRDFVDIFDHVGVSAGCLPVPKASTVGRKGAQTALRCVACDLPLTVLWFMTSTKGKHGQWIKLRQGDMCTTCERSRKIKRGKSRILGVDMSSDDMPKMRQPEPPREKPVCKYGETCFRWNPRHFADYSHPWLNGPYSKESHESESESETW